MRVDYDKDQLSYALANALKERDEAREAAHSFRSLYYAKSGINKGGCAFPWEGDEAREQNFKLRDSADTAIEYVGHTAVQQKLLAELKQETPQTDAAVEDTILHDRNHPRTDWVPADFARKLERERDEAVEEVRRLKIILDLIKKEAQ